MSAATRTIRFTLNGEAVSAQVATHENLVELLHGRFGLTSARESCGQGLCGCCTVLVNGTAVSGCLYLAAFVDGAEVETLEHADEGGLDAVQKAFIECGAFQCGFCTPGQIVSASALVASNPDPSTEEIRHAMAGNLCRCGTYPKIEEAITSWQG